MMYYGDRYGMMGGYYFIIPLIIIAVVVFAVLKLLNTNNNQSHSNEALNELNKKFVNGEISEQEYLSKKRLISKK